MGGVWTAIEAHTETPALKPTPPHPLPPPTYPGDIMATAGVAAHRLHQGLPKVGQHSEVARDNRAVLTTGIPQAGPWWGREGERERREGEQGGREAEEGGRGSESRIRQN